MTTRGDTMDTGTQTTGPQALDFDPDELRDRYQQERDKRLRGDGPDQYIELSGKYVRYAEHDPYVERRSPTRSRWPSSGAASAACSPAPA
jgi:hypothetical protein